MSDSTPTLVWTSTRTASWWQLPRQGEKAKSGSGAWSGTRLPLQECEDDTQIFGRRLRARMARNTMVALALVDELAGLWRAGAHGHGPPLPKPSLGRNLGPEGRSSGECQSSCLCALPAGRDCAGRRPRSGQGAGARQPTRFLQDRHERRGSLRHRHRARHVRRGGVAVDVVPDRQRRSPGDGRVPHRDLGQPGRTGQRGHGRHGPLPLSARPGHIPVRLGHDALSVRSASGHHPDRRDAPRGRDRAVRGRRHELVPDPRHSAQAPRVARLGLRHRSERQRGGSDLWAAQHRDGALRARRGLLHPHAHRPLDLPQAHRRRLCRRVHRAHVVLLRRARSQGPHQPNSAS